MPQVGNMHFPYTDSGRQAAENMAARTGQQMVKSYSKGKSVTLDESLTTSPTGCTVIDGYQYES